MAPSSLTTRASRLLNWRPISAKKCYSLINNHHYKLQGAVGLCSVCLQFFEIRKWPNQLCSTFKWCFRQFQIWGSEQPNIPKPCPVALKIWARRNTPERAIAPAASLAPASRRHQDADAWKLGWWFSSMRPAVIHCDTGFCSWRTY